MMKKIIKEITYFVAILLVLAFLQHPDLVTAPLTRIHLMLSKENYFHPLLWSSIVYSLIGLVRLVIGGILYLKNKIKK